MAPRAPAVVAAAVAAAILAGCGPPSTWRGLSPDHRTRFTVSESDGRSCLRIGDGDRSCFDAMALGHIIFSPDSRHVAYPVQDGDHWYVVLDGERGPPADGIGEMVFSPDSGRLAYTAERDGAWQVVVDGRVGEPFDSLFAGTLDFDEAGRRYAFVAWEGGLAIPVVDGRRGPEHQGVAQLAFSPDGRNVAYVARDLDGVRLVVDGVAGEVHETISELRFAPWGDDVSYVARDVGLWWVVGGEGRRGPYHGVRDLAYHPVDGRLAYVATDEDGERLVLGDEAGPPFQTIDRPVFGGAVDAWGYIAHDSTQSTVVMNGKVVDVHTWAGNLVFSDDGRRFAYVVRLPEADVIVQDVGVHEFDMVVDGTLQFVADGTRWACLAGDLDGRKLFVAVEGEEEVRPFGWSDFGGVVRSRATRRLLAEVGVEALRAWVRVESAALLSEGR